MSSPALVAVTPLGPLSAAAFPWRYRGGLRVTVVVKATLRLAHEGFAILERPAPIVLRDTFFPDPKDGLAAASDLAPLRPRTDVTLSGHAYAPGGGRAPAVAARLGLFRHSAVLDQTWVIVGERPTPDAAPLPFSKARVWRGPLSPYSEERASLLGKVTAAASGLRPPAAAARAALEAPVPDFPDDFAWDYFQTAPSPQRAPHLHGDEWIVLDGLHPTLPRVQSKLPGLRAAVRAFFRSGDGRVVTQTPALVADTLSIDADALTCSLVWRGRVAVAGGEEALPALRLVAALEYPGSELAWPDADSLYSPSPKAPPAAPEARPVHASPPPTPQETSALQGTPQTPQETPQTPPQEAPQAPPQEAPQAPPQEAPVASAPARSKHRTEAMSVTDHEAAARRELAPFDVAEPEAAPTPMADIPGAPWARVAPQPLREPQPLGGPPPVQEAQTPREPPAPKEPRPPEPAENTAPRPPAAPPPEPAEETAPRPPAAPHPEPAEDTAPRPPAAPHRLPPRKTPSLPIFHFTRFTVATLPWRLRPPRDSLTVIVKGTFDIVPGEGLRQRDAKSADLPMGDIPVEINHPDDNREEDPQRSLRHASDFVVFKARADVTLVGSARAAAAGGRGPDAERAAAAGGRSPDDGLTAKPVRAMHVSLRFGHPGSRFARRIMVTGDRRYRKDFVGLSAGEPAPFTEMPLVFERAFGGQGSTENPVGCGMAPKAGDPLPNLEDPAAPIARPSDRPAPACFAPIPMSWPERWGKLGTFDEAWRKTRWPYYPADVGEGFFQSAPAAQQLPWLSGDEPFELQGVHAEHERITGCLPGIRARAVAQRRGEGEAEELREIPLRLDTVAFDLDAMKVNLVWRGVVEVADDEASDLTALMVVEEALSAPRPPPGDGAPTPRAPSASKGPKATPDPGAPPASVEAIRESILAGLAASRAPGPAPPPARPANDVRTGSADEARAVDAQLEQLRRDIAEKLRANGIDPSGFTPPPAAAAGPSIAESLRRARVPEADIDALVSGLAGLSEPAQEMPPASAKDARAEVLGRLTTDEPFDGMDLSGLDLSGLNFDGRSLRGANLERARLVGTRFEGADLSGARLASADMTGADLDLADLEGADLHRAKIGGAQVRGARLDGAVFSNVEGRGADFGGASGKRVDFADGTWDEAVFEGAELPGADFSRATLHRAKLRGARMHDVRLFDARGEEACFDEAILDSARADASAFVRGSFRGTRAPASIWEGADLRGAVWFGARAAGASFSRVSAEGAVWSAADLKEANLRRANLRGARFLKANLMRATLESADLEGADARGANLYGAELFGARTQGLNVDLAIVAKTKLEDKP